jgi:type II secretory pathway predicted ATPase ExeA
MLWADRRELQKFLITHAKDLVKSGSAEHVLIEGTFGSGKTHTLKFIDWYINVEMREGLRNPPLSIYVENPGSSFVDFYKMTISQVGVDEVKNISRKLCSAVCYVQVKDLLEKVKIDETPHFCDQLIRMLSKEGMEGLLVNAGILSKDFARALVYLAFGDETLSMLARKWISGEKLTATEIRTLGVSATLTDVDHAYEAFNALITFLKKGLEAPVFICIDEFEDLLGLGRQTLQTYLRLLRHLIDDNTSNFSLIIATDIASKGKIVGAYVPLGERLERFKRYQLTNLTGKQVEVFIREVIDPFIIDKGKGSPFLSDGIKTVSDVSKGDPRIIVNLCSKAVQQASEKGLNAIDEKVIKSVVE